MVCSNVNFTSYFYHYLSNKNGPGNGNACEMLSTRESLTVWAIGDINEGIQHTAR